MLKKLNRIFAPVIFFQTLVLFISDMTSLIFAFELGNMTDSIIRRNHISYYESTVFIVLLLITIVVVPCMTFWGNKKFFLKSIEQENVIFENVLNQNPVKILQYESGTLSSKILDDGREIRWAIVDRVAYGMEFILMPLVIIYVALKTNIILTLIIVVLSIVQINVSKISSKILSKKKIEEQNKQQDFNNIVLNATNCHDFLFYNNYSNIMVKKMMLRNSCYIENQYSRMKITEQWLKFLTGTINIASYIFLLVCGAMLEKSGLVGLGTVITLVYVYQFLEKEFENILKFYQANSYIKELLRDMEKYTGDASDVENSDCAFEELSYDNFSLKIDKEKQLSFNANRIIAGKKYAIVGDNGSGKTTLLKLLMGVKEESKMNYKINESTNIRNFLKNHALYLDSDSFLACESVNEYILATGAKKDQIDKLCSDFELFSLLCRNGNELSGGERKRIYLVRMLLEKRDLILIDEPEVYLDTKWKLSIIKAFKENENTIIYTTHDSDFKKLADVCIRV